MSSSIREVKRFTTPQAYQLIKPVIAQKDWEIIGMTSDHYFIRSERRNYKFSRSTGKVLETFDLPPKKT